MWYTYIHIKKKLNKKNKIMKSRVPRALQNQHRKDSIHQSLKWEKLHQNQWIAWQTYLENNTSLKSRKCMARTVLFDSAWAGYQLLSHLEHHVITQVLVMLRRFFLELCRATTGNGNLLMTNLRLLISIYYLLPQASGITQFYIYREKKMWRRTTTVSPFLDF